jgi:hypothetical protein
MVPLRSSKGKNKIINESTAFLISWRDNAHPPYHDKARHEPPCGTAEMGRTAASTLTRRERFLIDSIRTIHPTMRGPPHGI